MASVPGAGALRERISIERVTTTRDDMGGLVETWAQLASVWAAVEEASAREQFRRQQIGATGEWTITVRYDNSFTAQDRIVWRGRTFQITGIRNPDQRRRFLDISATELDAGTTHVGALFTPTFDSTTEEGFDSTSSWTMDQAA